MLINKVMRENFLKNGLSDNNIFLKKPFPLYLKAFPLYLNMIAYSIGLTTISKSCKHNMMKEKNNKDRTG